MKSVFAFVVLIFAYFPLAAAQQTSPDDQAHIEPRRPIKEKKEAQPQGESSSRDSLLVHGGADTGGGDAGVQEMLPWDPHKAAKDIEVAQFYLKRKNYRAALDRFKEALLYKPRDAEALYGLAITQEKMDLQEQAYKNYQAYLEVFPGGPYAKDCQDALKRLEPKVTAPGRHDNTELREKIGEGEALLANNDFQEAYSSFAAAVKIAPDDPVANLRLGQALVALQRLDEARMYFRKCLESKPTDRDAAEARNGIAKVNAVLGK